MTSRRIHVASIISLFVIVFSTGRAHGQEPSYPYVVDTHPSRGIMPNSEQLAGSLDSIDPISGKLHIQIPLASLPAGHAGSSFDLSLVYDSHLFNLAGIEVGQNHVGQMIQSALTGGGWQYNFQNYRVQGETRYIPTWEQPYCEGDRQYVMEHQRVFRYRISLPDGSQHILHLLGYGDEIGDGYYGDGFYAVSIAGVRSNCAQGGTGKYSANATGLLTYYTTDGSYLRFQIQADGSNWLQKQWTLFYPDGRRVIGRADQAEHIYDANGNGVHVSKQTENGHVVAYLTDDFGRSVRIEYSLTSSSTEKEDKITVAGPNGPLEWRVKWQRLQIGGAGKSYVCYQQFNPLYVANCPLNFQVWAVKYIQLPLAAPNFAPPPTAPWTSFEFSYSPAGEGYGQLLTMRTPGGTEYAYCCDGYSSTYQAEDVAYGGYSSRRVTHDGVTEAWSYDSIDRTTVRVTAPDGGQTFYHFYDPQIASEYWSRNLVHWIEEPSGTVRKRQWNRNRPFSLRAAINIDPNNPYIERESVTVDQVAGQPHTVVTDYAIDKNGNTLEKQEYGWSNTVDGSQMESPGALLRSTETAYHLAVPGSGDTGNNFDRYWHSSAPRRLNAIARTTVRDESAAIRSITEYFYDNPLANGNITFQRRWDDATAGCTPSFPLSSVCPTQHREYDANGNLTHIHAPEIQTVIGYDGPNPNLVEYAPGTSSLRSFSYSWDVASGVLISRTDVQNGILTSYGYDAFGRQSLVDEAGLRQTQTTYDDEHRTVLVKRDLRTRGDGLLQTLSTSDQLGRVVLVQTSDGYSLGTSSSDGIKIKTTYRTFLGGTTTVTSTPYRTTADETLEWTCTQKDQSGRVTAVASFSGAEPSECHSPIQRTAITITDYHTPIGTPRTRVTDPAGRTVDRYVDALGRVSTVVEDPASLAFDTNYTYDALNNLTRVSQSGSDVTQVRTFDYTSLGRLRMAINPETGRIRYTYNDSGDVLTRQDDRGVLTAFTYDDLHRTTAKTYLNDSDITPDLTYNYQTSAPCIGLLESIVSSESTTSHRTCDGLGRVLSQTQLIVGAGSFNLAYTYWLNGDLQTMQYPSGNVVTFDVDDAGRQRKIYSQNKVYADLTGMTGAHTADGRTAKLKLGNNLWETRDYRTPGIPTVLRLGTYESGGDKLELQYNYSGNSNNGNLRSQVIRQGTSSWSQTYEYDGLNRLTCAMERTGAIPSPWCSLEDSWRQTFAYDRFGNRWVSGSIGFASIDPHEFIAEGIIDQATNHIVGSTYDAAGNQTWYAPWSLSYDAESRLTSATSASNGNSWFAYGGDGRRISKVTDASGTQKTFYIYDILGRLAGEYSTSTPPSGTFYVFSDILGTTRGISSDNGNILECADYSPFGRLLQTSNRYLPCHQSSTRAPQQFTGQVRDQETKLDYFGARYFSAAQGRFLSSDGLVMKRDWIDEPQRWNRYAYALNNPLKYVDPDGKDAIAAFFLGEQYRDVSTFEVIFSKETIAEVRKGASTFFGEHRRMTQGLSPVPTSKSDIALQTILPVGGKLGSAVAKKLAETAAPKAPVIIGETMKRVKEAASRIPGSKYLDDMPDFKSQGMNSAQSVSAMMEYNRKWMLKQLKEGSPIIDIGLDANRQTPSIFYQMEQNMLKTYKKLHPEFDSVVRP